MLTLWIVWAALTTVVLMLAIFRKFSTRKDDVYVHLADAEAPVISQQLTVARKLETIDYWGKTLTVVDAAYLVVLIGIVCFKAWRISLETMN
jgi:hypothetical protein